MRIRKTEAEIDKMQKDWGDKSCNHDCGYGIEWNNKLGCVTEMEFVKGLFCKTQCF